MAAKKLNVHEIRDFKIAKGEKLLGDGDGLFLRVRPESKLWVFIYSAPTGGRKKMMLGGYPDNSLADAREWAKAQRKLLDAGVDPSRQREQAKQEATEREERTLKALLDAYVRHLTAQGKISAIDAGRLFTKNLPDSLLKLPASEVRPEDVVPVLRKLTQADKRRVASKLRAYLNAAFQMGLQAAHNPDAPASMLGFKLSGNPITSIPVPQGGQGKPGERSLSEQEFRRYWEILDGLKPGDFRDLLRLQVLTGGQRIAQLLTATLGKVEGRDVLVILDGKGRREEPRKHVIPLLPEAMELIAARGGVLFGLDDPVELSLKQSSVSSRFGRIVKRMEAEGTETFRLGDIRRTVETLLASRGISTDTRAQLLSHGLNGVQAKHYDRHGYQAEKEAAIRTLLDLLRSTSASNVTPIRKTA